MTDANCSTRVCPFFLLASVILVLRKMENVKNDKKMTYKGE